MDRRAFLITLATAPVARGASADTPPGFAVFGIGGLGTKLQHRLQGVLPGRGEFHVIDTAPAASALLGSASFTLVTAEQSTPAVYRPLLQALPSDPKRVVVLVGLGGSAAGASLIHLLDVLVAAETKPLVVAMTPMDGEGERRNRDAGRLMVRLRYQEHVNTGCYFCVAQPWYESLLAESAGATVDHLFKIIEDRMLEVTDERLTPWRQTV